MTQFEWCGDGAAGPVVRTHLRRATESCARALADYQAGASDAVELQRTLFRHGIVHLADELWMLDLDAGRWSRYDGTSVRGEAHAFPTDHTAITAWRLRAERIGELLMGHGGDRTSDDDQSREERP